MRNLRHHPGTFPQAIPSFAIWLASTYRCTVVMLAQPPDLTGLSFARIDANIV